MIYKIINKETKQEIDYSKYYLNRYGNICPLFPDLPEVNKLDYHIIIGDWNLTSEKLPTEFHWKIIWLDFNKSSVGYYSNGSWKYADKTYIITPEIIAWMDLPDFYKY